MGRGFVYILTLAFVAILAFLTVRVAISDGVTIVVVVAGVLVALALFGGRGGLGGKEER